MNLAKKLSETAAKHADKPAVIFEDHVYTFADVDNEVRRYSAVMKRLGVRVGDRVALQLPKRPEFVFLELAVMSVGAVLLPLNVDYKPDEVAYFLTDSGSSLLCADGDRLKKARSVLGRLPGVRAAVIGQSDEKDLVGLSDELETISTQDERDYPAGGDDTAVICYTSGTTGRSKGAMLSHRNLVSNLTALHELWQWSDHDVLLHVLPLFHVHGLFVALHGGLNAGATIIMHEKFDPRRVWRTVEAQQCTILMGVPTMYQRLMNEWETMDKPPDLSSMRLFISGSAPLLENQFLRFTRHTGFPILERYGMTEAGMIASNPVDPAGRKATSVGFPLPGVELRVVDSGGLDVHPGEVGEILIRGDNVFSGYWVMPEKTRESFADGWFRSGDLGYLDQDDGGRLYLVGRAKELIITGGYNVYPKEIENVLEGHDGVREAAVVGMPDADFGERVVAVVALREPASGATPETLIEYCRERLAGYKCPKEVLVTGSLPRNAMGKLQKNELKDLYGGRR
ncbi:MAG: AMP-binding protein [Pseudomonadota bacterium]